MRPSRELFRQADQTYFATFQAARRQCFFRNERWSSLFLRTLERYLEQTGLHDFVVMPDHVHMLLSPQIPLERAIQLLKGGFSFEARRAFEWKGDIWQAGFSDHRIRDAEDWDNHCEYIRKNALSARSEGRAICGKDSCLNLRPLPQWLKPHSNQLTDGGAEAPPLQSPALSRVAEAPPLQSPTSSRVAEARPLQSSALPRVAEARPLQSPTPPRGAEALPLQGSPFSGYLEVPRLDSVSPALKGRTDSHFAKETDDVFRERSV